MMNSTNVGSSHSRNHRSWNAVPNSNHHRNLCQSHRFIASITCGTNSCATSWSVSVRRTCELHSTASGNRCSECSKVWLIVYYLSVHCNICSKWHHASSNSRPTWNTVLTKLRNEVCSHTTLIAWVKWLPNCQVLVAYSSSLRRGEGINERSTNGNQLLKNNLHVTT